MATTTLTIRVTEGERRIINAFAESLGTTASEFARQSIMESIEDAVDAHELLEAIGQDDGTRYSTDEVIARLS